MARRCRRLSEVAGIVSSMMRRCISTAVTASTTLGVVVACLTLRLNPQVHTRPADAVSLVAILAVTYAFAGFLAGASAGGCLALGFAAAGSKMSNEGRRRLESAALGVLGLGPLLFAALLPDVGLSAYGLTWLIFSPGPIRKLAVLAGGALILCAVGLVLRPVAGALLRRLGVRVVPGAAIGILLVLLCGAAFGSLGGPRAPADRPAGVLDETIPAAAKHFDDAAPVIVLCIDGADPDDVIRPMVEAGELPNFGRLIKEGTWGELESFAPTLSPAVWTTIATGRTKRDHGIHGFTVFRLPAVESSILEFPIHSGLNFRLIPLLEQIPGAPLIRLPYTSDMRQVPALWNMAGRFFTVGVFGWRTTWPVEPVNGFAVASAVTLGETELGPAEKLHPELSHYPADLDRGLPPKPEGPGLDEVRPYLAPGTRLDPTDQRTRFIRGSITRRNVQVLIHLVQRFGPRLTLAAFYSVDAFNHYFGIDHAKGGPFAPALAERYRFTDARLGELMDEVGPEVNLIVVSDHGYDFENNNHTHAPAGVFLARGPAFSSGRRVRGLTVFDITPLTLHLLGLPPGRDMPGAANGAYQAALDPRWLENHPVGTVASWGISENVSLMPRVSGGERDILEELRKLGYIE